MSIACTCYNTKCESCVYIENEYLNIRKAHLDNDKLKIESEISIILNIESAQQLINELQTFIKDNK